MLESSSVLDVVGGPAKAAGGSRWRAAGRFALSVVLSGALSFALARALRRPLAITTDIVGYPIFARFNIFNYFTQYYVGILFFPFTALLLYELFGRLWPRSHWPAPVAPVPAGSDASPFGSLLDFAPSLAVGACIGTGWLLLFPGQGPPELGVASAIMLGYVALLALAARVIARLADRDPRSVRALLGAGLAPLSLLLIEAVSRSTWVVVQSPYSLHRYQPIPTSVVIALLGVSIPVIWRCLRRAGTEEYRGIELDATLFLAVPALLFACTTSIPGPLAGVDLFHGGEQTGAAHLAWRGAFPWRDLVFIHGLFQDVVVSNLGYQVFGHTLWGSMAAFEFFATPAWWIANYFLFVYLFRRHLLLVIAALAVPFTASYGMVHFRFLPYPLILLALAAVIRAATWPRAFLLALCLVGGNILVPELAYAVPACGLVLVAYEWSHRRRGQALLRQFPRTLEVLAAGALLTAFWAAFLFGHGALGAFIDYYRDFAPGHELTGGIPITERLSRRSTLPEADVASSAARGAVHLVWRGALEGGSSAGGTGLGHARRDDRDRPLLPEVS